MNHDPTIAFSANGPTPRLFSVGHSNHDWEKFVSLLRGAAITALADVRSSPFSTRYPQFNRIELEHQLACQGIRYVFLGDRLGGRPPQPSLYDPEGRVDYQRVRAALHFRQGIDQLVRWLNGFTVAMVCAEEDPLDCHRGLMIAPALVERGITPVHLRGDGSIESTAAMEARLLAETRVGAGIVDGLFAALLPIEERQQYLAQAYREMARRKSFRRQPEEVADGE
jgi:uncharacterized protein (DUF488 family)